MTRVVVTGAAGFIGSNIVKGLNQRGIDDIIAVDDLTQGDKFRNLADLKIADYVDLDLFYDLFAENFFGKVEAVFHEGACSDTMEADGKYMMDNNYTLSCGLFKACQERGTRLLYASSAAVYGGSDTFREAPEFERPLNVYGYSKLLFDQRMRRECGQDFKRAKRQVAGFRYFNVYGPREQHKGRMASVAFHQFNQFRAEGKVKLFGEYAGYGAGEQRRDFVFIDDLDVDPALLVPKRWDAATTRAALGAALEVVSAVGAISFEAEELEPPLRALAAVHAGRWP